MTTDRSALGRDLLPSVEVIALGIEQFLKARTIPSTLPWVPAAGVSSREMAEYVLQWIETAEPFIRSKALIDAAAHLPAFGSTTRSASSPTTYYTYTQDIRQLLLDLARGEAAPTRKDT